MVGEKFGLLTVLERMKNNERGDRIWKCQCECGNTTVVKTNNLRAGKTKSCGCIGVGNKRKDDVCGKDFRNLKIIRYLHSDIFRESVYEYQCKCGTIGQIRKQNIGKTKDCPNCRKKRKGKIIGAYWASLQSGAKSRNLVFEITKENAWEQFVKQNGKCALSGIEVVLAEKTKDLKSGLQTASLDRIDSSRGYVIDNIQWLHKKVNQMKWDSETNEFLRWCQIITERKQNEQFNNPSF